MKAESIYDGLPYLYAEQLKGKRVVLTIKSVRGGVEFYNARGVDKGFDIAFDETEKILGVVGPTVRRQLFLATGTESTGEMVGKKITLYPIKSTRSATGQAIRIAIPEQHA